MIDLNTNKISNPHYRYQVVKALPGISKPDLETKLNDEGLKGWHFSGMIVLGTNNWLTFERVITKGS